MGQHDHAAVSPAAERLLDISKDSAGDKILEPVLCERVEDDTANNRVVFHLKSGIKFHDGTEMAADDVIFQYELAKQAGYLQFADKIKSIKKLDRYTVEIKYTEYNSLYIMCWGWIPVYSKAAWEAASGGDMQKGKEWARNHIVGTGPFKLSEFKEGDHLTWVKNHDYWRSGQPYLDRIEVYYVTDAAKAREMFITGKADKWIDAPPQIQQDLVRQGYVRISSEDRLPYSIWPNTADPSSKWNDKRLREAIEYALDKQAIAEALGPGIYNPLDMLTARDEWGFDPGFPARKHDITRAQKLLAEAGYPYGIPASLLVPNDSAGQDTGQVIKSCLEEAGFKIELVITDPSRYHAILRGNIPGPDLAWAYSGKEMDYLATYLSWFSPKSFMGITYLGHSSVQVSLDKEIRYAADKASQEEACSSVLRYLAEECRVIPVYSAPASVIIQPYVHTDILSQGFMRWQAEKAWMDKH